MVTCCRQTHCLCRDNHAIFGPQLPCPANRLPLARMPLAPGLATRIAQILRWSSIANKRSDSDDSMKSTEPLHRIYPTIPTRCRKPATTARKLPAGALLPPACSWMQSCTKLNLPIIAGPNTNG
jgi:hypothetical protein